MKYLLVLALCLTSAMVVMAQSCSSGNDCQADECCVSFVIASRCRKRKLEGETCTMYDHKRPPRKYPVVCPCQEELECVDQQKITIFGRVFTYDSRCQKKEPVTEEPQTEEPETHEPETEEPETEEPETEEPETEEPETEEPETEEPETEEPETEEPETEEPEPEE